MHHIAGQTLDSYDMTSREYQEPYLWSSCRLSKIMQKYSVNSKNPWRIVEYWLFLQRYEDDDPTYCPRDSPDLGAVG